MSKFENYNDMQASTKFYLRNILNNSLNYNSITMIDLTLKGRKSKLTLYFTGKSVLYPTQSLM